MSRKKILIILLSLALSFFQSCICEPFIEVRNYLMIGDSKVIAEKVIVNSNDLLSCRVSSSGILFDNYDLQNVTLDLDITNKSDRTISIFCNDIVIKSEKFRIEVYHCQDTVKIAPGEIKKTILEFRETIIDRADRKINRKAYEKEVLSFRRVYDFKIIFFL